MGRATVKPAAELADTVVINGQECMKVTTVVRLAGCGIATVYRAIDWGGLELVWRGLVDAKTARAWINRWSDERGPQRARKKPRGKPVT